MGSVLVVMAHVQATDGGAYAYNTIPVLVARIAIEPVGVAGPLGAIGSGVKVHESLSCQREWLISTAPRHRRRLLRCPNPSHAQPAELRTLICRHVRTPSQCHNAENSQHHHRCCVAVTTSGVAHGCQVYGHVCRRQEHAQREGAASDDNKQRNKQRARTADPVKQADCSRLPIESFVRY